MDDARSRIERSIFCGENSVSDEEGEEGLEAVISLGISGVRSSNVILVLSKGTSEVRVESSSGADAVVSDGTEEVTESSLFSCVDAIEAKEFDNILTASRSVTT